MYRLCLDLELNKENDKITDIIQIGAVIGHIYTGQIKEQLSYIININKPLDPFISELCQISDIDIKNGISINEAYNELEHYMNKYECSRSILTWGKGDQEALKAQAGRESGKSKIGHRYTDVKTLYCEYRLANNESMKAGLEIACQNMGLEFIGTPHNALWDAYNTFLIYRKLLGKLTDHK